MALQKTPNDTARELGYNSLDTMRTAIMQTPKGTGFTVPTGNTVPSTAIGSGLTRLDVTNARNAREQQDIERASAQTAFTQGLAGIQSNPQSTDFLSSLIFAPQTATSQQRDTLVEEQRGLLQQERDFITGRTQDSAGRLTDLQAEAGVPELQQQFYESNKRIANIREQIMSVESRLRSEAGQTLIGVEARLTPAVRQLNLELGSEALYQSAILDNLAAANQNINTIISLETQDRKEQLANMQFALDTISQEIASLDPKLKEEATQRLQQYQLALSHQQQALEQQQSNRLQALQIFTEAAKNGAPQDILGQLKNAQTPEQALAVAGGFMTDPLDRRLKAAQIQREEREGAVVNWSQRANILKLAEMGDPMAIQALGYDPAQTSTKQNAQMVAKDNAMQELEKVNGLVNNALGISSSSGTIQSPLLAQMLGLGATGIGVGAGTGAFFGGVGAIPGAIGGGLLGLATGAVTGADAKRKKEDFLAQIDYVLSGDSFEKFRELRQSGVTFGQTTEREWTAVQKAANELESFAKRDSDGKLIGFKGSESSLKRMLIEYQKKTQAFADSFVTEKNAVDQTTMDEIMAIMSE